MEQSWLVQRLKKPFEMNAKLFGPDNPFAFGGGLKNGGLSDEAMNLIRGIFRFDYMGSAEFEFGAVPKTLHKIANNHTDYTGVSFVVTTKEKNESLVYVICNIKEFDEVKRRIEAWAFDEWSRNGEVQTKEHVGINSHINGSKYSEDQEGWLELDNGYFFFTDEKMFEQTRELFEVETHDENPIMSDKE